MNSTIKVKQNQINNNYPSLSELYNPIGWYDASDTDTLTFGSGSNVTDWANKGTLGSSIDLSASSAANQPLSGSTQNNFNLLTFDGQQNYMGCTQADSVTHIFVASKWTSISNNYKTFLSGGSYDWHGDNSADLVSASYAAAWVKSQPTQSTSQLDASNFVNVTDDKWTTFSIYSINLQSGYTGRFKGVGGYGYTGRGFNGSYGEVLVYQTDYLTTEQINKITGYLAHKWGTTSLLPSDFEYKNEAPYKTNFGDSLLIRGVDPGTDITQIKFRTENQMITDNLSLYLDAGYKPSYNGSGTIWKDASKNGNNGTLVNGVGYTADNGGALTFDGTNTGVNITENITLGSDDWTLEMWVYLSSGVTAAGLFSYFLSSTALRGISYSISSNTFGYQHRLNGGSYLTQAGVTTLSDETWYYLVSKRENDVYYTYIDGIQDTVNNSAAADHTYFADNVPYYIGYNRTGVANLDGRISNVRFYKGKALTEEEIQQNYDIFKGRFQ